MKKDDYGFYGSGLDGYVHYRQGMAESARNAPSSHGYNSYDSSDSDYDSDYDSDTDLADSFSSAPVYSRPDGAAKPAAQTKISAQAKPEKPEGAKLPPPVTPDPRPAAQKEESSLAAVGKWLSNIWNAAWVISLLAASILGNIMDHSITQGALYAAYVVIPILRVTSVIELVRAIVFLSKL